jgi:hypothetical protein
MTELSHRPSQRSSLSTQGPETEIAQTEAAQSEVSRNSRHLRLFDRFTSVFSLASGRARRERAVSLSRNPSDQKGPGVTGVDRVYIPVWRYDDPHLKLAYDELKTVQDSAVRTVLRKAAKICHSEACRGKYSLAEEKMKTLVTEANSKFAADSTKRSRSGKNSQNSQIVIELIPHQRLREAEYSVKSKPKTSNQFGPFGLEPKKAAELRRSVAELRKAVGESTS